MSGFATQPQVVAPNGVVEDVHLDERAVRSWPDVLRRVAGDVALTRVLLLAVAWLAQWLLATGVGSPGFRLDIWRRWDASLYLDIAQRGYPADLLLFPTAVFLMAPSSEALFLAGAIPPSSTPSGAGHGWPPRSRRSP